MLEETRSYTIGEMAFDLDDFCNGVIDVLRYWVAVHMDPETWAADWLCGYQDYEHAYENCGDTLLNNGTFQYTKDEWRLAAYKYVTDWTLYRCSECETTFDSEYTGYCDCADDYDEDNWTELDADERVQYMDLSGFVPDWYSLRQAFLRDVFAAYQDAFGGMIESTAEDMQRIIRDYDDATFSNLARLQLALEALECEHTNGYVVEDHGSLIGLDSNDEEAALAIREDTVMVWDDFTDDDYLIDWLCETDDPETVAAEVEGWTREQAAIDAGGY